MDALNVNYLLLAFFAGFGVATIMAFFICSAILKMVVRRLGHEHGMRLAEILESAQLSPPPSDNIH